MKEEEHPHKITVCDPEARKQLGGVKQYHTYAIKGADSKGTIDHQRRYSDFELLRTMLVKKWPGMYIPSLPSKLKLTNSDSEFLELRSKYFEKFLKYLSSKDYIWYSEELQFFLKNKEMSCQKVLTSFSKIEFTELFYRYKTAFKSLEEKQSSNFQSSIVEFEKSLSTLFVSVQEFRNRAEENNKVQRKYQYKYSRLLLHLLERYQKRCLKEIINEEDEKDEKNDEKDEKNEKDENEFKSLGVKVINETSCLTKKEELEEYLAQCSSKILFQELKRQKREILAFQQGMKEREEWIKKRDKVQQKIKSHENAISELVEGKTSFMSKIRGISSESQIKDEESIVEKYKSQLKELNQLCTLIDLVTQEEIIIFKKERIASYYNMVKDIMRSELELIDKEKEFWKTMLTQNDFTFQMEEAQKIINSTDSLKKELQKEEKGLNQDTTESKVSKNMESFQNKVKEKEIKGKEDKKQSHSPQLEEPYQIEDNEGNDFNDFDSGKNSNKSDEEQRQEHPHNEQKTTAQESRQE